MNQALADRILVNPAPFQDTIFTPEDKTVIEGEIISVGSACGKDLKEGMQVVFKKSMHPTHEGLIILREDQILAEI